MQTPEPTHHCPQCGGTILAPATSGAERGSCHCPRGPGSIRATLYYGTDADHTPHRHYAVEWFGRVVPLTPPTLEAAVAELNRRRAAYAVQYHNRFGTRTYPTGPSIAAARDALPVLPSPDPNPET